MDFTTQSIVEPTSDFTTDVTTDVTTDLTTESTADYTSDLTTEFSTSEMPATKEPENIGNIICTIQIRIRINLFLLIYGTQ